MDANTLRRLNWLWKHRHNHDDDPDFQQQITIINNQIGEIVDSGSDAAAFTHVLRATSQSIAAGGELIEWDAPYSVIPQVEFNDDLPSTTITIPIAGYYNVGVAFAWDSWTDGGIVEILRSGNVVWPPVEDPGIWSSANSSTPRFRDTAEAIPFLAGETVSVFVDHGDSSSQDLATAWLAVELVRPYTRGSGSGIYAATVLADAPIGYWRFDTLSGTTVLDIASDPGGPYDLTLGTANLGQPAPSLGEPGVMQDGSGNPSVGFGGITPRNYALGDVWGDFDLMGTPFSVEIWFNTDGSVLNQTLIQKKRWTSGASGWRVAIEETGPTVTFQDDGTAIKLQSSTTILTGTDYHVVVTWDSTTARLYINGVEEDTDTGMSLSGTAQPFSIAWNAPSDSDSFAGRIDEAAVYQTALTPTRVLEHYTIGTGG